MNSTVENIILENSNVVFVLESPHTAEVFHGYPLAGDGGREMSKYLLGRYDVPFGLIAKEGSMRKILQIELHGAFSIANVSKIPLQKAAYEKNNIEVPKNIDSLERLKKLIEEGAQFQTKHRLEKINELKTEIYNSFKSECEEKLKNHSVLIPCGRFARTFCEKLNDDSEVLNFKLINDIPHPSNGWETLDMEIIDLIKSYINGNN